MSRVNLKGIHRVRRKLADGTVREHHYAWRGGPKLWSSDSDIRKGSAEYVAAFAATAERPKSGGVTAPEMVDRYLDSADFTSRAPRTQADYRKWALRFADEFKDDPAALFEDSGSRVEVNNWRNNWKHSPKQYDYAATVVCLILNWAVREGGIIRQHHCDEMRRLYASDRAEIVWSPADLDRFNAIAPEWVRRILTVATQTGLRPGDLIRLSWQHVEDTPQGRRIRLRTASGGVSPLSPSRR